MSDVLYNYILKAKLITTIKTLLSDFVVFYSVSTSDDGSDNSDETVAENYTTVTSGNVTFASLPSIDTTTETYLTDSNEDYLITSDNYLLYSNV